MKQEMLIGLQYAGVVLLMAELAVAMIREATVKQSMLLVISAAAIFNTLGYAFELQAKTQQAALEAVKLIYIGKPFIVLGMLLFIVNYCQVRYPRWAEHTLFAVHGLVMLCVLTCEQNPLFYATIGFSESGAYPHLVLTHGPLYYIYLVLVGLESAAMIAACIWRLRLTQNEKEKRLYACLAGTALIPLAAFGIYASGITKGYDATAPAYILGALLLMVCTWRFDLFGTLKIAHEQALNKLIDGIVVLNNSDEVLYANRVARELYPPLGGKKRPRKEIAEMRSCIAENGHIFSKREVYQLREEEIREKKITVGHMIVLENTTKDYFYTKRLQADVKAKTAELARMNNAVLSALANMVEMRDDVTGTHIKNTSRYVTVLCAALRDRGLYADILTDDAVQNMVEAAPLHDVGKIAIPDAILCKPGRLTDEEFTIIKTHAALGSEIIAQMLEDTGENAVLRTAQDMAHYHHERWDGKGYPTGLSGESIPLSARVMAVADVYDALISKRSYKAPMPKEKALAIMAEGAGTQFDPAIVNVFIELMQKNGTEAALAADAG